MDKVKIDQTYHENFLNDFEIFLKKYKENKDIRVEKEKAFLHGYIGLCYTYFDNYEDIDLLGMLIMEISEKRVKELNELNNLKK